MQRKGKWVQELRTSLENECDWNGFPSCFYPLSLRSSFSSFLLLILLPLLLVRSIRSTPLHTPSPSFSTSSKLYLVLILSSESSAIQSIFLYNKTYMSLSFHDALVGMLLRRRGQEEGASLWRDDVRQPELWTCLELFHPIILSCLIFFTRQVTLLSVSRFFNSKSPKNHHHFGLSHHHTSS